MPLVKEVVRMNEVLYEFRKHFTIQRAYTGNSGRYNESGNSKKKVPSYLYQYAMFYSALKMFPDLV